MKYTNAELERAFVSRWGEFKDIELFKFEYGEFWYMHATLGKKTKTIYATARHRVGYLRLEVWAAIPRRIEVIEEPEIGCMKCGRHEFECQLQLVCSHDEYGCLYEEHICSDCLSYGIEDIKHSPAPWGEDDIPF